MIDGYIKRSDALELTVYQSMMGLNMAQTKLREMPGEDVRPVVHGHWKNWKDEHACSVCRGVVIKVWGDDEYDYCPYCGNPMDECVPARGSSMLDDWARPENRHV